MKNKTYQFALAAITLTAFLFSANIVKAAPVRINQVVQVVNAKPGKAKTGGFTQLRLADDNNTVNSTKDDSETPQDDRVIITKTVEVVTDDACECPIDIVKPGGFPKWALLGLAAIPVAVVLLNQKDKTPTPTPTTPTPTTPTPTTPTPTPPTPTPPTPPPTPEPVPEPMTILLFGTGLAGIGVSARRRLRRKAETTEE